MSAYEKSSPLRKEGLGKGRTGFLLQTMFLGSTRTTSHSKRDVAGSQPFLKDWALVAKVVTDARLEWAVDGFSPYKSSGVEGIYPVLL